MPEIHYEKGKNTGYVQLNHVEFHHLTDKGYFNPIKWFRQNELCRLFIGYAIMDFDPNIVWQSRNVFALKQDLEFTPNMIPFLERLKSNTSSKHHMPVRFTHVTTKVNRSSVLYTCQVEDLQTDLTIMNNTIVMVLVNPVTRRPVSFPQPFRDFIEECSNRNPPPQYVKGLELVKSIPQDRPVFTLSRKVSMMETDYNGHTNNSSYAKLAYECLGHAISQEYSVKLSNDLSHSFIKKWSIRYINESKVGQVIETVMWQSDDDHIHFILRSNKTDLAYATIIFYS